MDKAIIQHLEAMLERAKSLPEDKETRIGSLVLLSKEAQALGQMTQTLINKVVAEC